jgi:hypothetical protein
VFALTQHRFDAWLHLNHSALSWEVIDGLKKKHGFETIYASVYPSCVSLLIDPPTWATPVFTGPLETCKSLLFTTPFDAWLDVKDGPQRLEELSAPHQLRLLTSPSPEDIKRTVRFLKGCAFSPFLWRVVLQDRHTQQPLPEALIPSLGINAPLLGLEHFLQADDVGVEYDVLGHGPFFQLAPYDKTRRHFSV